MKLTKEECVFALAGLYSASNGEHDEENKDVLQQLIEEHFTMIEHMKETSLYDVYEYEKKFAKATFEPMRIVAIENEDLKKEVNDLRKQLGLVKKYKVRGTR